ncbi:hypothetical protein [Ruminococcus flavefaciens]|uniref:hypothetical protein n=1 Tax=Ruminococcus flavefaciens TaxID=1265 RepID=UPI0026EEB5C8|nr:hypothetical protein [Ruminococcus flavefaciens]
MKTKSRILAFLLGFIIIFNISFARPQTVEAVVGVDDAVIIGLLFTAVTGAVFIGGNALSGGAGADAFVDWMKEHHSSMVSYVSEKSQNGYVKSDVYSFLIDKSFMIDFIKCVHEFLSSKGEFTSEGYTYSSGDSVANGNLQQYIDFFAPMVSESLGISLDSARYWVQDWGFIKRASEPLYVTFCREDFYGNSPIIGFTIHYSTTGYMDFNNNQTINSEYPTFWVNSFGGGVSWSYNTVFNDTSPFTPYDPVSYFYYTPGVEGTSSSVTSTAELSTEGQAFASDPDTYAEKAAANATGTTVVHHTDGTKEVKEGVEVDVPVTASGEGEYSHDSTRDTTINKPASDVYGDEGTLTDGAVSIDSKIVSMPGDIAAAISDTYGDGKVDFDDFKITKDITTTFPFSLPWDIYRVLHIFQTDPKVPVFEFDFGQYYPFNQVPAGSRDNLVFRLDLSEFSDLIAAEKFFVTIFYALGLIMATRSKMIRG